MTLSQTLFIPSISPESLSVIATHEGGFGRVFIVEAKDLTRYALKTLRWEQGHDRSQLRDEALTLADISPHPNVIDILGLEWIEGDPFIVLPYCERTLADMMDAKLSHEVVRCFLEQIASGLCFLHQEAGILHLDLKPHNVLLDGDGNWRLSDFGLSKCLPKPTPGGLTQGVFASGITGTVAYMSPEHFVYSDLSPKSDVFAIGIILYEMLFQNHPFLRETLEATARSILFENPRFPFFGRNDALMKICRRCLDKNPRRRPTSADVVEMLRGGTVPNLGEARSFDLVGTINRGIVYMNSGDFSKAESLLLSCLRHEPWSLLARINLAEVYLLSDQTAKALEMARKALELVPWCAEKSSHFPTLFTNMAYLCLAVDPHESLKFSRQAIRLSPKDWQALANAAEACRLLAEGQPPDRSKFLDQGLRYIGDALAINPHDVTSLITYGNLLLIKRDFATLSPLVVDLINQTEGDNVPARVLLIRTLTATAQLDDAERWLEPMTRYGPLKEICDQLRADLDRRSAELGRRRPAQPS